MATLTEYEKRWIVYVRKVLAQDCGCACDADDIAWPGFIGPKYADGRILIFGAIHEIDALKKSGIYDVVPDVKKWFEKRFTSDEDDKAYLDRVFNAYKGAIPKWLRYTNKDGKKVRGAVWSNIEAVISDLRLDYGRIAFTNLAKCGIPTGTTDIFRTMKHEAVTPAMALIEALDPKYVIVAVDNTDFRRIVRIKRDDGKFVFRQCTNLTFKSGLQKRGEWLREDALAYRKLMS